MVVTSSRRSLILDAGGNVLPIAAAGLLVSVAIVGGGIDMSRAYKAENRLQAACDAAVLAGRKNVSTEGFDSNAEAQANAYFNSNFIPSQEQAQNTQFTPASNDEGATVEADATTNVASTVMRIFGVQGFDLAVHCSASMGAGNSDVVMVLDNTGSMGSTLSGTSQTRIQALRAAMKNFYGTLQAATAGSNARIRYGFVPYSSSVNVGQLIYDLDPDYLVDSWPIQSREAQYKTVTTTTFDHWGNPVNTSGTGYSSTTNGSWNNYSSTTYSSNSTCLGGLPADTPWANNGSATVSSSTTVNGSGQQVTTTTTTQPQRMTDYTCRSVSGGYRRSWRYADRNFYTYQYATSDPVNNTITSTEFDKWLYKQVTYNTSVFKSFNEATTNTGYQGAATTSLWEGCIEERKSVAASSFSYSSLAGITPSGALDLDIDAAPDAGNDDTKWAPMWPDNAYLRTNSSGSYTSSSTSNYGTKASSYCPYRSQLLTEMADDEFDAYADSLAAQGSTYLDIGMLWGGRLSSPGGIFADNVNEEPDNGAEVSRHIIFMTDGIMEPNYRIQQAYGIEWHDRRVTSDGSSNDASRHTSRFLAICRAIKAKGIRIWVIAFTSGLSSDLTTCASDNSSFNANDADELNEAFQEIAKQVGELRIIQ